jgi:hypothetical protein
LFTEIRHIDNRRVNVAPLDKSHSNVTHDTHRKLDFSTLAHDTLGITPLAAGVVTTLRTRAKISFQELIDYTSYLRQIKMIKVLEGLKKNKELD